MKKFVEYLDSKKNIVKPKVKVVADEVDMPADRKKNPPKGVGMQGGKQPYVKDNGGKPAMAKGKGFGDLKSPNVPHYDVEKETKPSKLPTAESPFYIAAIVRESIKEDPRIVETIVRDLKRNGLLGVLVGELLTHKETFSEMACVMGSKSHGQCICERLARAIREVSVPFSDEFESGEDPDALPPDDMPTEDPDEMDLGDEDMEEDPGMEDGLDDMDGLDDPGMEGGEPCQDCGGMGQMEGQPCMACGGTGQMPDLSGEGDEDMMVPPQGHEGPDVPPPALENLMRAMNRVLG